MSYLGNSPVTGPARILEGSGTGDGSTTSFAMGFTPASEQEVFIFIDGVKQDTDAYSISGSNCVFTTAPASGENLDFIGYEVGKSTVPQDNSVDQSKINTGSITPSVQSVITKDGELATGTTQIPVDDTIPQNTEGDEYMTVSITPTSATNKLIIEASVFISHSATNTWQIAALFQDSTANALAVNMGFNNTATASVGPIFLSYEMTSGTTSSTTFKIRAGSNGTGTTTFNGQSGARLFGGVFNSFIKVTEVLQ